MSAGWLSLTPDGQIEGVAAPLALAVSGGAGVVAHVADRDPPQHQRAVGDLGQSAAGVAV